MISYQGTVGFFVFQARVYESAGDQSSGLHHLTELVVVDLPVVVLVDFLDHLSGEFNGRAPGHDPDQVLRTDEPIAILIELLKAFSDL